MKKLAIQNIHPELRQLLEAAIESAQKNLKDADGLLPTSIAIGRDGKFRITVAAVQGIEGWAMLIRGLRDPAASREIRSAAVYRDARVSISKSRQVDAIHVVVEHARHPALQAFQVYQRDAAGNVAYDQIVITRGEPSIFVTPRKPGRSRKRWWHFWK